MALPDGRRPVEDVYVIVRLSYILSPQPQLMYYCDPWRKLYDTQMRFASGAEFVLT